MGIMRRVCAHILIVVLACIVYANARCLASCDAQRCSALAGCCHHHQGPPHQAAHFCAVDLTATPGCTHSIAPAPRIQTVASCACIDARAQAVRLQRDDGPPREPVISAPSVLRV
jgi:hypothetical protein